MEDKPMNFFEYLQNNNLQFYTSAQQARLEHLNSVFNKQIHDIAIDPSSALEYLTTSGATTAATRFNQAPIMPETKQDGN